MARRPVSVEGGSTMISVEESVNRWDVPGLCYEAENKMYVELCREKSRRVKMFGEFKYDHGQPAYELLHTASFRDLLPPPSDEEFFRTAMLLNDDSLEFDYNEHPGMVRDVVENTPLAEESHRLVEEIDKHVYHRGLVCITCGMEPIIGCAHMGFFNGSGHLYFCDNCWKRKKHLHICPVTLEVMIPMPPKVQQGYCLDTILGPELSGLGGEHRFPITLGDHLDKHTINWLVAHTEFSRARLAGMLQTWSLVMPSLIVKKEELKKHIDTIMPTGYGPCVDFVFDKLWRYVAHPKRNQLEFPYYILRLELLCQKTDESRLAGLLTFIGDDDSDSVRIDLLWNYISYYFMWSQRCKPSGRFLHSKDDVSAAKSATVQMQLEGKFRVNVMLRETGIYINSHQKVTIPEGDPRRRLIPRQDPNESGNEDDNEDDEECRDRFTSIKTGDEYMRLLEATSMAGLEGLITKDLREQLSKCRIGPKAVTAETVSASDIKDLSERGTSSLFEAVRSIVDFLALFPDDVRTTYRSELPRVANGLTDFKRPEADTG